jgi:hypothetical protein
MNEFSIGLLTLVLSALSTTASAADLCVTGLKGTIASSYIFKVSHSSNTERLVTLLDTAKNQSVFSSKAENRFTQFNTTGYGVCSVSGSGIDPTSGAQFKLELKTTAHYKNDCNQIGLPTNVEYLTLKITPRGTTLGDDLTAYALTPVSCP